MTVFAKAAQNSQNRVVKSVNCWNMFSNWPLKKKKIWIFEDLFGASEIVNKSPRSFTTKGCVLIKTGKSAVMYA